MIFDRNVKELALDFSIDQKAYMWLQPTVPFNFNFHNKI